jgi:hypothetical protein
MGQSSWEEGDTVYLKLNIGGRVEPIETVQGKVDTGQINLNCIKQVIPELVEYSHRVNSRIRVMYHADNPELPITREDLFRYAEECYEPIDTVWIHVEYSTAKCWDCEDSDMYSYNTPSGKILKKHIKIIEPTRRRHEIGFIIPKSEITFPGFIEWLKGKEK